MGFPSISLPLLVPLVLVLGSFLVPATLLFFADLLLELPLLVPDSNRAQIDAAFECEVFVADRLAL